MPSSALLAIVNGATPFALMNVWTQLPRYEENALNGGRAATAVLPANLPLVVAGDFNSFPAVAANTVAASRCSASYESSSGW